MTDRDRMRVHFERHLGAADVLVSLPADAGEDVPFEVAGFTDQPRPGARCYATLGLCEHPFADDDGSAFVHELLLACDARFAGDDLILFLMTVGRELLRRGEPIDAGMVIDFGRPLVTGVVPEAVLFYEPVYFAEELAVCEATTPPAALAWVVPLLRPEVDLIAAHGVDALTDRFAAVDPDLLDFDRPSVAGG